MQVRSTLVRFFVFLLVFTLINACGSSPNKKVQSKKSNLKNAEAYLAYNAKQPGILTTSSGLQYRIVEKGTGCRPRLNSRVKVHYETKLADSSKVVDSSYARGKPSIFSLQKMIKAWKEGIPMMREGATWEFHAHPDLAYGEIGSPPYVLPNAITVYKVQLLGVERCK